MKALAILALSFALEVGFLLHVSLVAQAPAPEQAAVTASAAPSVSPAI